jgi:serine protease Do
MIHESRARVCGCRAALGVLLVCGALVPAGAAAQDPPRRVRIVRSDGTDDSTVVRVTVNTDQINQLIRELIASKATEQSIVQGLREVTSDQGTDSKRARVMSDELARIAQKNARIVTTIEMSCGGGRQPDGYIGAQISELQIVTGADVTSAAPLHDFPRIDSVYPGSPASKAGIRRGDLVLFIGGQDARRPVPLDKLLTPLAKLPVRIQRDGIAKDLTITVEKRPADYDTGCAKADRMIAPEFDAPMVFMRILSRGAGAAPGATPGAAAGAAAGAAPRAPAQAVSPDAPFPPVPPMAGFVYGFPMGSSAIAGATLMALDDDWRAALGVDNGVLVTKVLPGTPAKDSGLHAGDVIISADGQPVASVRALSRIVSNATGNSVKLQTIRSGKPQVVTLRWQDQER